MLSPGERFNVKRENIHKQVEEFARTLENMFGLGASQAGQKA
jgi:hypothetical protein